MVDLEIEYLVKSEIKINKKVIGNLIDIIFKDEKCIPGKINVIIASNNYVKKINKRFLSHNYNTDIITFAENKKDIINGELFISIDKVIENADIYSNGNKRKELSRVIIHGILHLLGYEDYNSNLGNKMRNKEDYYLLLIKNESKDEL